MTRELFKFHLGIDEDTDFIFHQPASEEQLCTFANDPSKGPSLADPHFDVNAGMLSDWNKKLLRLLQVDFQSRLPDICARENMEVPLRSDRYYMNLVSERFQRLAQIWKQGQPKLNQNGALEAAKEVEKRMITQRVVVAKKQRHYSQHLYVRGKLHTKLITHDYRVTEIPQQTHYCGKGNQGEGKQ